jgi:hypothetical protein
MAIVQKRTPPKQGQSIIGNALRDLWGAPDLTESAGGATIDLSQPLPVYSLGLEDIQEPGSIKKAKPVGWRYLIEKGGNIGYADLVESSSGDQSFASLSRNRNAERLNEAAHVAESVAKGLPDCEARILDIPAIHIAAIWLFGTNSTFIPYIDPEMLQKPDARIAVDPEFLNRITARASELRQHLSSGKLRGG